MEQFYDAQLKVPLATHGLTEATKHAHTMLMYTFTSRLPKLAERGATKPPEIQPQHCPSKTPCPSQPQ
eukprot:1999226-Amphidinium_carterae.2